MKIVSMMKKKIDFIFRKLKMLMILPLIALVFYTFAKPEYTKSSAIHTDHIKGLKETKTVSSFNDFHSANKKSQVNNVTVNTNLQGGFFQYEQMPQFPGGEKEMIKFIKSNLKYPDIARGIGVSGTVIINFVVGIDGKISRIKVVRGIGSGCDEEAVRVMQLMPNWIPGKISGKVVNVSYTVPVRFVKPIENDELSQLIEHDRNIGLYTPAQKMQIIKNREKISDSIKILNFKEYRDSDSRDYQFCYSFIDYTPQNKYICKILDDKFITILRILQK